MYIIFEYLVWDVMPFSSFVHSGIVFLNGFGIMKKHGFLTLQK